MRYLIFLFLITNAFAAETEVAKILRNVKERKEAMKSFRAKVSLGDRCPVRDYKCFQDELMRLVKGHAEELVAVKNLTEPFYQRSLKEGFPPCEAACQQNMLSAHINVFLTYLRSYHTKGKEAYRVESHPTVSGTKVRALMDLIAFHHQQKNLAYVAELISGLKKNEKNYELSDLESGSSFSHSVLCHLSPGDPVYDDILGGTKKSDETYRQSMKKFNEVARKNCAGSSALIYKGIDQRTRDYYGGLFKTKLSAINCKEKDYACVRKHLREIGIRYSSEVPEVAKFMSGFVEKSKEASCDETCQAQNLVKTLQTWITYFSSFDREKLASTLDWKEYPDEKYKTLTEDVDFYLATKEIFLPLLAEFGKIDPRQLKDEGLKSEMRSLSKDLSDLASGKFLKDSVICTMEPWTAAFDRYMVPYEDKARNKKFEADFLEFKESICK